MCGSQQVPRVSRLPQKPLCDLLTVNDLQLVTVALEGIDNVLKAGELDVQANSATNPYTALVDEAEGLDKLKQLQARHNVREKG